jgi:hypothetical protein
VVEVPALPVPAPPVVEVPALPVPAPPVVKVPALPVPVAPVVEVPALPVPAPPVVEVPALPVPVAPVVKAPALPLPAPAVVKVPTTPTLTTPTLPSVKGPLLTRLVSPLVEAAPSVAIPRPTRSVLTVPTITLPTPSLPTVPTITAPTPPVPTVPTITVPTPRAPEPPAVKLPIPSPPEPPVVKLPTLPVPKPPVVKVPTPPVVKVPTPPVVKVPTVPVATPPVVKVPTVPVAKQPVKLPTGPTLPKVPSVKAPSPTVGGISHAPSQATSTASGLARTGSSPQGPGTTAATSPATVYPTGGLLGGYNSPLAAAERATELELGGLSRGDQARTVALLSSAVRRLQGCLRYLPDDLRRVLELMAGVNAPAALSPQAVALQLHVSTLRVSRLERRALRRLRATARTHTCGAVAAGAEDPFAFGGLAVLVGEEGGPAGGVESAHYAASASSDLSANVPSHGGDSLFGINNPSLEGGGLLLILALLGGALLIGLRLADGLRLWPTHHELRSRWISRHPWNWHH